MHPLFLKTSGLIHDVIGSAIEVQAIEVHRIRGPGCWSRLMNVLDDGTRWNSMELDGTRWNSMELGMRGTAWLCDEESGQYNRSLQTVSSRIPASM